MENFQKNSQLLNSHIDETTTILANKYADNISNLKKVYNDYINKIQELYLRTKKALFNLNSSMFNIKNSMYALIGAGCIYFIYKHPTFFINLAKKSFDYFDKILKDLNKEKITNIPTPPIVENIPLPRGYHLIQRKQKYFIVLCGLSVNLKFIISKNKK